MEGALGVRLFDRTTRRVVLTETGRLLSQKMKIGVMAINEDLPGCQGHEPAGRCLRGRVDFAGLWLRDAGTGRSAAHLSRPDRQPAGGPQPGLAPACAAGQGRIRGLRPAPAPAELVFEPLFEEEVVAVVPAGHALAHKTRQSWKKVGAHPLIEMTHHSSTRRAIAEALEANGVTDKPAYEVAAMATALSMVRAELGIAVMPLIGLMEASLDGLAICRMVHPVAARKIAFCRRRDRTPSAAASGTGPAREAPPSASLPSRASLSSGNCERRSGARLRARLERYSRFAPCSLLARSHLRAALTKRLSLHQLFSRSARMATA